jgi:hypothetical protein
MAGFFDTLLGDTPERSMQVNLLLQGLAQRNGVGGLLNANMYAAQAPDRKRQADMEALKLNLLQAQVSETQAQAQERAEMVKAKQAAAAAAARNQGLIAGFGRPQPGMGPTGAVNDALPPDMQIGAQPQIGPTGSGGDYTALLQQGVPYELVKQLADSRNLGREEVARTIETMRNGRPVTMQFDKFGNPVGRGQEQWKAPVFQNLGGRTAAIDPVSMGERGSFAQSMSPEAIASNKLGWANNALTRRGQDLTDARSRDTNAAGKIPAGYRMKLDGSMEAIPGGPADLKAGADGQKKVGDARDVLTLLNEVDELLPKSTGSYTGAGVDAAIGGIFGSSTGGARAGSQLKALQGALIGKMPKMTGPQSDKDVQLYREMAGQVGDVTIPVSQRQAASAVIRKLNEKYAGMPEGSSVKKAGPFSDASKEQRYQAWKAGQGK